MKLIRTLCVCWMVLQAVGGWAAGADELSKLRFQAAKDKSLVGYSDVCSYLYAAEVHPELLSMYADSIRMLGVKTQSLDCFIEYYIWKSESRFKCGDFKQGFVMRRKALALAEKARRVSYISECSSNLGYYFNVYAHYDSARFYLKKGMKVGEKFPELADEYRTMLTNYASSFLYEGQIDSALVYTLQAEKRSIADKDTAMWIENLNQLGTLYRRKKNLDDCIRSFEQAIRLCETQGNYRIIAYIYGNIAASYNDATRLKEAASFSKKALEYALKQGNPQVIGVCYTNLGVILCNQKGREEEGMAMLQQAIPIIQQLNNNRSLCDIYYYVTDAYRKMGQLELAMHYLLKLDKIVNEMKTDVEYYRYYRIKASILQDTKQFAAAVNWYQQMITMLENGYKDARDYDHYMRLSECQLALTDNVSAYKSLRKAYALRDSVYHKEYTEQLTDYSAKYETKEKELQIIRLQQAELIRETELLRSRILLGAVFCIFVIVVFGFLYARQRQKVRLAKLNQAASDKERQFLELQKETEQRLTRKYIDGLESERQRMATELHDDVCNNLLALEINVRSLTNLNDGAVSEPLEELASIRQRLRSMSHELMPPVFQYATIDEMLADYISHLVLPEGMLADYSSTEGLDWREIPQTIGFEFYRIVQEAVNNALKYSDASHIRVALVLDGKQLSVEIADDGKGFDASKKSSGIGLRTIRQRADSIGAEVTLNSGIDNGVYLRVTVTV